MTKLISQIDRPRSLTSGVCAFRSAFLPARVGPDVPISQTSQRVTDLNDALRVASRHSIRVPNRWSRPVRAKRSRMTP